MKLDFLQNNVNKTMLTTSVACLYLRESLNVYKKYEEEAEREEEGRMK